MHNTVRYVAVENGELAHRPDMASEVLRKAYGDCKGSATLIKEMLCSLGIDARHVWLGTDVIDTRWTDVPNISSGNHMIAAVVSGDSITYIDGTLKHSSPGELSVSESGVQTIIEGDADNYMIGETPQCDPALQVDSASWAVTVIPSTGSLAYEGNMTLTGMKRKGFVSAVDDIAPAKRNDFYEAVLGRRIKGGNVSSVACTDTCGNIVLHGVIEQNGVVKNAGDMIMVDINPAPDISNMRFDPSDRKVPGMLSSTAKTVVEIVLSIPDGMVVDKLPSGVNVSNNWIDGSVSDEMSADSRSLKRKFTFITRRGIVDVDQIKEFNDDIKKLSRACSANIVLKRVD